MTFALLFGEVLCCVCLVTQWCLTLCDPMDCCLPGSSVHGDSPGRDTGVGCHAILQGIFPTQVSSLLSEPPGKVSSLLSEPPGKPYLEQTFQEFTFLSDSTGHCRILPRAQCFQCWKVDCIRSLQPGGCDFKSGCGR